MDANIDNEENDDQQQQADEKEKEQQAAAAAKRRCIRLISALERKEKFPVETRREIDEQVDEFLDKIESTIHWILWDTKNPDSDLYDGLDSTDDYHTEEEIETAVRFYPDVLLRKENRNEHDDEHDDEYFLNHRPIDVDRTIGKHPIQICAFILREDDTWGCNSKAVPFIPLLVRIAIELGLYEEQNRGGLLIEDEDGANVLQNLMRSDTIERNNQEHHALVDEKYLQVLIQLRKMGLLKKEDIQRYDLLNMLCTRNTLCNQDYFSEKRFRFLVQWDPTPLIKADVTGHLPIHIVAFYSLIRSFQIAFESGIRYYPKKKGIHLIFRKTNRSFTPFQMACEKSGHEQVMKVIEDTLVRYSDTPINISEALVMAAIDEDIHLDCVYFLLRREPDVLVELLSPSSLSISISPTLKAGAVAVTAVGTNGNGIINNSNGDSKKRKRKRG